MRNGIQIGDKVDGERLYGPRGTGRTGTVTHIEEKDSRYHGDDIIRLSVTDDADGGAEQTGLFYRKDIRIWTPRTVVDEKFEVAADAELERQIAGDFDAAAESEARTADQIRADHMAEMHVGEPNADCDLCALDAVCPGCGQPRGHCKSLKDCYDQALGDLTAYR